MKSRKLMCVAALTLFAAVPTAVANTTWYVNGVNGSDSNNCKSPTAACKTIGHAISLALSGDTIRVAAATYNENLTLGTSLRIIGAGARTTIIDGGGRAQQKGGGIAINTSSAKIAISGFTIRNGRANLGGGIFNAGTLTVSNTTVSGNIGRGGGSAGMGAGIANAGTVTITMSTISGNTVSGPFGAGFGGGLWNIGTAIVTNSTLSGNTATSVGGGIENEGNLRVNNSTIAANTGKYGGAGIDNYSGTSTLANSVVANNSGGNCYATISSNGYNLSSDSTCNFNGPGDLNNTNPMLGPLQNNGGLTQTMALLPGSPAIDSGNPSGCTDDQGHLLKIDQRGLPRPDTEDAGGCDRGAYERQTD
jgi:hypothetical protein